MRSRRCCTQSKPDVAHEPAALPPPPTTGDKVTRPRSQQQVAGPVLHLATSWTEQRPAVVRALAYSVDSGKRKGGSDGVSF